LVHRAEEAPRVLGERWRWLRDPLIGRVEIFAAAVCVEWRQRVEEGRFLKRSRNILGDYLGSQIVLERGGIGDIHNCSH
jgi:hypothetical protein